MTGSANPINWPQMKMMGFASLNPSYALFEGCMTLGETTRAIFGAMAGFLYGCVLTFLAVAAAGSGHGSFIPLYISSAPLSVLYLVAKAGGETAFLAILFGGTLVWAVLGRLVALAGRAARIAAALLVVHYLSALALIVGTGEPPRGMAGEIPDFFKIWAPVYLIGQVVLWWQISRRSRL
jgi:hypothetical protein